MKRLFLILLCCLLLAGCGKAGTPTPSTEPQSPTEEPTEEITTQPAEEVTEAPTQGPTEAQTEAPTQAPTEEPTQPATQEPAGTAQSTVGADGSVTFTLYLPNHNADGFNTMEATIPIRYAGPVVEQLIDKGVLNSDISVNSAKVEGKQLNVDFNSAFLTQLTGYGTSGEYMMIGSVVNSLLSAFNVDAVYITVDGETMETGHEIYDHPIGLIPWESETTAVFTLYLPNENADGFETAKATIPIRYVGPVIELLMDCGVLNEDISVNSARVEGKQLNVDFNAPFLSQLVTYGTAGEKMMIGSVVNSLLSAFNVDTVYITVDGKVMESGHVVYDFPMSKVA